jgi:protein-disulfide isomerase
MRFGMILLLAVSVLAQTGAKPGVSKSPFDKAAFEMTIRYYEFLVPDVDVKIADPRPSKSLPGFSEIGVHLSHGADSRDEVYYLSADGDAVIPGFSSSVPAFAVKGNPFQINLDKLFLDGQPSFGPANAPVTIVEFGDLECPSCKAEAPVLREILPSFYPDKVRVVFKDYPLESIHPWARAASDAARCVYRQNPQSFWKVYDWFYATQEQITPDNLNDKVMEWAGKNSIDTVQLGRCVATKAADPEVARNISEAHALNVTGTPTMFINGRKISGVEWSVLQQIIEAELAHQSKSH